MFGPYGSRQLRPNSCDGDGEGREEDAAAQEEVYPKNPNPPQMPTSEGEGEGRDSNSICGHGQNKGSEGYLQEAVDASLAEGEEDARGAQEVVYLPCDIIRKIIGKLPLVSQILMKIVTKDCSKILNDMDACIKYEDIKEHGLLDCFRLVDRIFTDKWFYQLENPEETGVIKHHAFLQSDECGGLLFLTSTDYRKGPVLWYNIWKYMISRLIAGRETLIIRSLRQPFRSEHFVTHISLYALDLIDLDFTALMLKCLVIKTLLIVSCKACGRFSITHENLRLLSILKMNGPSEISIACPSLKTFEYEGMMIILSFEKLCKLNYMDIYVLDRTVTVTHMLNFLGKCFKSNPIMKPHLSLRIAGEVESMVPYFPVQLCNSLTRLDICLDKDQSKLTWLVDVLDSAPNIKEFSLTMWDPFYVKEKIYSEPNNFIPDTRNKNTTLTKLQINGFSGTASEIEFLYLIMEYAMDLSNITLMAGHEGILFGTIDVEYSDYEISNMEVQFEDRCSQRNDIARQRIIQFLLDRGPGDYYLSFNGQQMSNL